MLAGLLGLAAQDGHARPGAGGGRGEASELLAVGAPAWVFVDAGRHGELARDVGDRLARGARDAHRGVRAQKRSRSKLYLLTDLGSALPEA